MTITFDGTPLVAERGEPIAAALLAAGKHTVARSPKFHRPRGPACFRAACDGCLARVDDVPNVMTCLEPAEEGRVVVSQNRLGPRNADLLRVTDWFFPEGLNHHELFAGVPGVQNVMMAFARRVAGLGRLPKASVAPRPAARRRADVLIVGAGAAGMTVAVELARAGRRVEVIDDQLAPGGAVRALAPPREDAFGGLLASFLDLRAEARIALRSRAVAAAIYGRDVLVASEEGAEIVEPRAIVLACGAHDGAAVFEGNDVPGVMSARAACFALEHGALPGRHIVAVVPRGGGTFARRFAERVDERAGALAPEGRPRVSVVEGEPIAVRGSSRVRGVVVVAPDGERDLVADALLVDGPRTAAYELAGQAGGRVELTASGYVVRPGEGGALAPGVFATGEMVGTPLEPRAIAADARRVCAAVAGT